MSYTVIDCKHYLKEAKDNAKAIKTSKVLYIVTSGLDKASKIYVNAKVKDFNDCGILVEVINIPESYTTDQFKNIVDFIQSKGNVGGVIVQLPLPSTVNEEEVLRKIKPKYDVDGLSIENTSFNYSGNVSACTAVGIVNMLKDETNLAGKTVAVLGRSNIVGKPLIPLLLNENATVTSCNSYTDEEDLQRILLNSDVVISAIGKPNFIKSDFVYSGAIVVDVGINRLDDGKLVGDVDIETFKNTEVCITTVPGGVGLLTRAALLNNFVKLVSEN